MSIPFGRIRINVTGARGPSVNANGDYLVTKSQYDNGFNSLETQITVAAQGITTVGTIANRDAFYATEANRGKLVYVNNNNGSATDPANGVYEYAAGAPRIAQSFYAGFAAVVQPKVDQAEAAKTAAQEAAAASAASAALILSARDAAEAPRDAVAIWPIDRYDATNRMIPNLIGPAATPSKNLKRAPRRAFNSNFWNKQGASVSDRNAPNAAGLLEASTITLAAGGRLNFGDQSGSLPAGTYTIGATVQRGASSDQTFGFATLQGGGVASPAMTATAAYQRFSYTFTVSDGSRNSYDIALASASGATLVVDSIELFAGAVDPGMQPSDGHIYLGGSHASAAPIYANGVLSSSGRNAGVIQLPARYGYAKWSHVMLIEQTAYNTYPWVMADLNNFFRFTASPNGNGAQGVTPVAYDTNNFRNFVQGGGGQIQQGGYINLVGKNYHQITRTYDGVAEELWVDDIRLFRNETTITPRQLQDFLAFTDLNFSGNGLNVAGLIGLWDRALTATEIRNFYSYQRLKSSGLSIPGLRNLRVLVVEGDSNHGGQSETCWPWLFKNNDAPENIGAMWASVGSRLDRATDGIVGGVSADNTLVARASAVDTTMPPDRRDRTFVFTCGIGTNDLAVYPGASDAAATAAFIASYRAYMMARAAAGYETCLFTLQTKGGAGKATHDARRAILNADIRANWALYGLKSAARIIDIAADARIGTDDSQTSNPTMWADALHWSAAGNAVVESIARPVINGIA